MDELSVDRSVHSAELSALRIHRLRASVLVNFSGFKTSLRWEM
jgi:hypothetical protein